MVSKPSSPEAIEPPPKTSAWRANKTIPALKDEAFSCNKLALGRDIIGAINIGLRHLSDEVP
jgi:hypothetical protein